MSKFHIVSLVLAATAITVPAVMEAATIETNYKFSETTPLATGKWVKISLNGSGVYEISYDKLREMGFSDPSKVAVYGTGGIMRDFNFTSLSGSRYIEDAIQPIASVHANNKVVFYALGNALLEYTLHDTILRYKRNNLNVYSDKTYYMLTDSHPAGQAKTSTVADKSNVSSLSIGYGGLYHEKDMVRGGADTGALWWGEDLLSSGGKVTFPDLKVKYCIPNMSCNTFVDVALLRNMQGSLAIEINGIGIQKSISATKSAVYTYYCNYSASKFNVDENHVGTGTLSLYTVGASAGVLNLDYWTIAYPMSLEYAKNDPEFDQAEVGFNNTGSLSVWKHPVPDNSLAWDITDPMNPVQLEIEDGNFYCTRAYQSKVVVFNPAKTMKQIDPEYEAVPNRNLHALQNKAVDMLIFTTPTMLPYAKQLAKLHEEYDGIVCEIVTPQELYDEFNAGTPEATCYRLMAKMLYQHPEKRLKNVLFFGPLVSDTRNIHGVPEPREGMIGYQDYIENLEDISALGMDFYGVMTDNVRGTNILSDAPISLGVGILPVENAQQAETVLSKIRAYLETEDLSGLVNETFIAGCPGDSNMHENQAIEIGNKIQNDYASRYLNTQFAHETLWMDPLSTEQLRTKFQNALKRGKGAYFYIGHANHAALVTHPFFSVNIGDLANAGNTELGLGYFAGCDLTHPDGGEHGIGDLTVIGTKGGFISTICATRSVQASQNYTLAQKFIQSWFTDENGKLRTQTPSIGEAYALSKTRTNANSEVAYVLVGDPSLKIPIALSKVQVTVPDTEFKSGQVVTVTGKVINSIGGIQTDYNGYVTLKLMEPSRRIETPVTYSSQGKVLPKMTDYDFTDLPIMAVRGKVTNGEFTVKFPLPAEVDQFAGDDEETVTLSLLAGTYDNNKRLGGAGDCKISLAPIDGDTDGSEGTTSDPLADNREPVIILTYDQETSIVNISVSDDCAILPGVGPNYGTTLTIDGKEVVVSPTTGIDVAVNSYSASVDIARLGTGAKQIVATATDLSGNTSTKSMTVRIENPAPMSLTALSEYAVGDIDFKLSGAPDGELNLIVATADGTVVKNTEISGSKFNLDTTDIEAGTYRAAVRRNSARGEVIRSNWVTFTVID